MSRHKALRRQLLRQIRKAGNEGVNYVRLMIESDHAPITIASAVHKLERFRLISITQAGQLVATQRL